GSIASFLNRSLAASRAAKYAATNGFRVQSSRRVGTPWCWARANVDSNTSGGHSAIGNPSALSSKWSSTIMSNWASCRRSSWLSFGSERPCESASQKNFWIVNNSALCCSTVLVGATRAQPSREWNISGPCSPARSAEGRSGHSCAWPRKIHRSIPLLDSRRRPRKYFPRSEIAASSSSPSWHSTRSTTSATVGSTESERTRGYSLNPLTQPFVVADPSSTGPYAYSAVCSEAMTCRRRNLLKNRGFGVVDDSSIMPPQP